MKIYIKTYGCTLNQGDSEVLKGIISKEHKIVDSEENADLIIVNTCGVKTTTQNKIIGYVKKTSEKKKVIVGGCLPSMINIKKYAPKVILTFDTKSTTKINEIIKKQKINNKQDTPLGKPRIRTIKETAIVPISEGCLGKPCTYCSVKLARGELHSYRKEDITSEVEKGVKEGCNIIKLTAQDTGCWGKDINDTLPNLLREILKIKGEYKIRLGMMNPNYTLEYLDELIEVYQNPKMIKFLHIPVQSGSDKVLKDMKRGYTVEEFKKVVGEFRKEIKGVSIATDFIAGFPTETEEDFKKTIQLIKEVRPEVINISMFAPRPKTEAARMKQLKTQTIKERSRKLSEEYKKIKKA
ncbi:MAG: tRNA (N(6)-L-threonylcarbamoyladenosine(37)-C(2))-methylthiotransferase [archaeon]